MRGGESPPFFYRAMDQPSDTDAQSSISPMLNVLSDLVIWDVFTLRPKGCLESSRDEREGVKKYYTRS